MMSEPGPVDGLPAYAPCDSNTIFIALIGLTGCGKSTFINLVSGSKLAASGSLDSCTQEVEVAPTFELDGRQICLVDTPGFDDTDRSEVEILKLLRDFLERQFSAGALLHGFIYLHRITDVRVGGVAVRTLSVFRKLCGSDSLKNVMIVTNRWSKGVDMEEQNQNRERQLRNDVRFFKLFLDDHAAMVRHDNTVQSAREIIRQIVTKNHPLPLDIQTETVEEGKTLISTSAGITLHSLLMAPTGELQAAVNSLEAEFKKAVAEGDRMKRLELQLELNKRVPDLARLANEIKNLQGLVAGGIGVMQHWENMSSKERITTLLRRSWGKEDTLENTAFWSAMGDTTKIVRGLYTFFYEECPLPHSLLEQLLDPSCILQKDDKEKLARWFSAYKKDLKGIETKMESMIAIRAKAIACGRKKSKVARVLEFLRSGKASPKT